MNALVVLGVSILLVLQCIQFKEISTLDARLRLLETNQSLDHEHLRLLTESYLK